MSPVEPWPEAAPFVPRLLLGRPPDAPRQWQVEGTLAYLDISGFTTLSEQLARRGRIGTEDLVATLTRIFTLLMSASDDGGDVVKFAGDAMLVLYEGPGHAAHAAHATQAVQRLLRVAGDVHLAGARARLSMSVGIHSGRFDLLLTGRDQRNLVVCGPGLDRLVALQEAAVAGQALISEETAALLPERAAGPAYAGELRAVVLGRVPPVDSVGAVSSSGRGAATLGRYLPAAFQARHDLLLAESEHRRTAMGFVQVTGLDALLAADSALAAAEELTERVEAACRRFEVTLLDTDFARDGFRYFLAAGTPRSVEDPPGRLLQALLDITAYAGPLGVRAGATAGEAFAGAVGSAVRRTFTVMGDATNLAARLTARAPAGGVLVHTPALAAARVLFDTAEHAPLTVKGKAEPLAVRVVTGVDGLRPEVAEPPFTARVAELAELTARLGRVGAVEVADEAGMGKSRLVEEAARRTGRPVVTVSADPFGTLVAHQTLRQLLRPLLDLEGGDDPATAGARLTAVVAERVPALLPWLPLLASVIDAEVEATTAVDELDDRFRAAKLRECTGDLLDVLLPPRGLVVVDGAQWVDQSSADVLAGLDGLDDDARPWDLLLSRRDGERGLHGLDREGAFRPGPLTKAEARALAGAVPGRRLTRAEVEAIVARAEGNPQFVVELARAGLSGELPHSIEQLVAMRVDELDSADRHLLRQAAVLGSRFLLELLAEATGEPPLDAEDLDRGLGQFVAIDGGEARFVREVYREVAYEQLAHRRRRDVHARVAEAIERRPELVGSARLPLLARHLHAAADWAGAYRHGCAAVDEARADHANVEAAELARLAIDAGRRDGRSAAELRPLQVTLGEVLALAGRHDEAIAAYAGARRGLSDPAEQARLAFRIGMVRRETHDLAAALRDARRVRTLAARIASPEAERLTAEAELLVAGVRYRQGRSAPARAAADAAAAVAATLPEGEARTQLVARAHALHDSARVELDGLPATYGEEPLRRFREIGDLYNEGRFSVNVAIGLFYAGEWARAVELYRRSLEVAERIGDVVSVAMAKMNIGEVLAYQGQGAAAVELLGESVEELAELHNPFVAAHASCFLGAALRVAGDPGASLVELDRSAALFAEAGVGAGWSLDELASRRLEALADLGSPDAAALAESLAERGSTLAAAHAARLGRSRSVLALAAGDLAAAREHTEAGLAAARTLPLAYDAALSLLARADLPDSEPARARADRHEAGAVLAALGVGAPAYVVPDADLRQDADMGGARGH